MSTPARQDRIDDLFAQAVDLPADERKEFLNSACDGYADLRAEVEKLLAAHEKAQRATDFLATPPTDGRLFAGSAHSQHPLVGERIGPYEVIRWLGGGGFGHVYLAFRSDDYRQKVAIKVLRSDIEVNERILARFELERQLLADLQHEHIARLLYGGTLETGRPYIVMEYVKGKPITEYCDANRLTVGQRLALVRQVCEAVAYAHRFGAIHRDIKPGNIFVADDGNVKLLDFGIAKMVDPISQRRMVTMSEGGMPMTPEYACPEQVRGPRGEGISTASDVYSLGVVLYELLTGRRPYELHGCSAAECEHIICEKEPRNPSTVVLEPVRISREDDTEETSSAQTLAAPRQADPQTLNRLLKGDLEQIVLKAIRKEPKKRYPTVEELIEDLDSFQRAEPVKARPISRRERAVRWIRRNTAVAGMSCAIVIALLAGTIVSTYFAIDARQKAAVARAREQDALDAKRDAEIARADAVKGREEAENSRKEADRRRLEEERARRQAQEVTKFIVDAFASPDPNRDGRTITVAEVLDRAEKRLEKELLDQPVARAAMLDAIGKSRAGLGFRREGVNLLREAQRIRERELGPAHDDTLDSLSTLANVCRGVDGMRYLAIAMQQELVDIKVEKLGADAPDALDSLHFLGHLQQEDGNYSGAIDSFEKSLAMRRQQLGNTHPVIVEWSACLISAYDAAGRADDALRLMTSLFDSMGQGSEPSRIGESPGVDTLSQRSLNDQVASNDSLEAMYQRVIAVFEQNLTARKREFGANSLEITNAIGRLKQIYRLASDLDKALQLQEEEVAIRRAKEPNSQATLSAMNELANDYDDANRTEEAIVLYKEILALRREKLGLDHPDTLSSLSNLAAAYGNSNQLKDATALYQQLFEAQRNRLGAEHPDTLRSIWSLANAHLQMDHQDEAFSLLNQVLALLQQESSIEDYKSLALMSDLAGIYTSAGRFEESRRAQKELCKRVMALPRKPTPYESYWVAVALLGEGKMDENRQVCQQLLQSFLDTGYKTFADRATYAYVAGEVPASSAKQLVAAAEIVTDQFVGNERILGACLYRAGQYEKALRAFEESHRKFNPGAWDYCFLAMLHEKLRNHEKASKMLAQAREAHRRATSLWYAKVETDALLAEATSLIEGKASTSSD